MTLEFLPEVRIEGVEITTYYEGIEPGLGERFNLELESMATAILARPLLWRLRRGGYRRVNLPNFPYYLAYVLRGECVRVVALGHGARLPGYFQERLRRQQTPGAA